jgi:hypothetical protein
MKLMSAKRINVEPKVHAITTNYRQVDVFGGYTQPPAARSSTRQTSRRDCRAKPWSASPR